MSDSSDYSSDEDFVDFVDLIDEDSEVDTSGLVFLSSSCGEEEPMDIDEANSNMSEGGGGGARTGSGHKFQKELWQIKHLPYYEDIQKEADEQFRAIKFSLAQAVLKRDVRPGLLHWACELDKYILLYGRRFSKEDHIWLVRLFYQMIVMKDLEFRMVKTFSMILSSLIDKRELLTQKDVELDWRPLYDIYCLVQYKNMEDDGTFLLPDGIEAHIESLICKARVYFPPSATQEILDEVRPYICPWDTSMLRAMTNLNLFLPTIMCPDQQKTKGFGLWMQECWYWFENIQNTPPWEMKLWGLFARLARDCCGQIDWSPYLDVFFTRVLRYLGLTVGSTGNQIVAIGPGNGGGKVQEIDAASVLIVYILGGAQNKSTKATATGDQSLSFAEEETKPRNDLKAQDYVTQLFRALESFFHPSNFGKWTDKLLNFLYRLSLSLCQRLHKERHKKPDWQPQIPQEWKLTDAQVDRFVESVLPCALQGMFTKYRQDLSIGGIRYLSQLSPKLVVPAVLERLYPALETLTEPHRLLNSMTCLVAVALALTRDRPTVEAQQQAMAAPLGAGDSKRRSKDKSRKAKEAKATESAETTVVESIDGSYRKHVISLLHAMLPGLDPNDIAKSMVTFQAISLFAALVPMVDCSEAIHVRNDLTEEERELCSATATLDDFVTQLMDRIFILIETTAHNSAGSHQHAAAAKGAHPQRLSMEESLFRNGIFGVFKSLLSNCSTKIYEVAVNQLYSFVQENVFESRIAADTVAEMIFCAVRTSPTQTFPRFLSLILDGLKANITEETWKEEEVEDTVTWFLVLSTQLVRCDGSITIQYKEKLLEMLRLIVPLKCRTAYEICGQTVLHLLMGLSFLYMTNHEKKRLQLDQQLDHYLPIRHWAEPCNRKELKIVWHVPSEEEMDFLQEIFEEFLAPELNKLKQPEELKKEEILKSLSVVQTFLQGAGCVLPVIEGTLLTLVQTEVNMTPFRYTVSPKTVQDLTWRDGGHIRMSVYKTMHGLTKYMLAQREDDTKSLAALCRVYNTLVFQRGMFRTKYDQQVKGFNMTKKVVGDVVRGKNASVETVVTEIVLIQHHKRLLERSGYYFTDTHAEIMKDLFRLATSAYSAVRKDAQAVVEIYCYSFPYCYNFILDDVLALLKEDEKVSHEQFKGALYVLFNGKKKALCLRQTWRTLGKIWPAIVRAQHSEKPSIIKLLEDIQNLIVDGIESFQIRFEMSRNCIAVAKEVLWKNDEDGRKTDFGNTPVENLLMTEGEEERSLEKEKEKNEQNERIYYDLMEELGTLATDPNLHWRHADLAQSLLSLLIRKDTVFSVKGVSVFIKLLTHDSIKTRKISIGLLGAWLKISRPKAVKKQLSLTATSAPMAQAVGSAGGDGSLGAESVEWPGNWGVRQDNSQFLYRKDFVPKSKEEWDKTEFVEKTHWGFYCWPKWHKIFDCPDNQPWNRKRGELTEQEGLVCDTFTDEIFVDKFAGLLSVEEKKGEDMFQPINYCLFKGIFRNYGETVLKTFRPLLERLAKSEKEGEQRLATEIVTGMLQGAKLWEYDSLDSLWSWLGPLMVQNMENLTSENYRNWGTCVATVMDSRDPRRFHWLLEILSELASRPMDSSFHTAQLTMEQVSGFHRQFSRWAGGPRPRRSSLAKLAIKASHLRKRRLKPRNDLNRLFLFQGAINSEEWRVFELWHRLMDYTKLLMAQPYQNLRERVGSLLFRKREALIASLAGGLEVSGLAIARPPTSASPPLNWRSKPLTCSIVDLNLRNDLNCISSAVWFDMPGLSTDDSATAFRPPTIDQLFDTIQEQLSIVFVEAESAGPQDDKALSSRSSSTASLPGINKENNQSSNALSAKNNELKVPNGNLQQTENPERQESVLVLKTVLCFLNAFWGRAYVNLPRKILELLPVLCYFENETSDDELKKTAHLQLFLGLAKAQIFKAQAGEVLDLCELISETSQWWKSKVSLLRYLQVQIFSNLFMFTRSDLKERLRGLVDKLLRNERLEVREAAAQTLSGFFHCGFFTVTQKLIKTYFARASEKDSLLRHSGVLALGAVIQANPYSVPKYLPDVLMHICLHANDPQPIQGTVKKVLSEFKRTHHDSWHEHKAQFTSDQLGVLTDLLVSPNYYV